MAIPGMAAPQATAVGVPGMATAPPGQPHPPSWPPRGFGGLGAKPGGLGQSGPFSGRKISDLDDSNLYKAMTAMDPTNPGSNQMQLLNPEGWQQRNNAYNAIKNLYDARREEGIGALAESQYPAQVGGIPFPERWNELDEYNLKYKGGHQLDFNKMPDKVSFPGDFSHPENAVAYTTEGSQFQNDPSLSPAFWLEGEGFNTDYQRDVVGGIDYDTFDWDENALQGYPAAGAEDYTSPAPSLWVTGDKSDAALQQNADIARNHYNYIYSANPWGY